MILRWWRRFVAQVDDFDGVLFSELDGLVVELSSSFWTTSSAQTSGDQTSVKLSFDHIIIITFSIKYTLSRLILLLQIIVVPVYDFKTLI